MRLPPGGKILAHKILRQGYYWPTMMKDALSFVQKCHECQIHSVVPKKPPTELHCILSPIPFAMWGIDLMGPFPIAKGQVKFTMATIDYMTKWVEAEPLRSIADQDIINFLYNNVITRYDIPEVLVSDNDT